MNEARERTLRSAGLLLLRVGLGAMMVMRHGGPKLFGFADMAGSFSDPLGVGSHVSLALAIFAEFLCAILLVLGLLTRLAAVPLVITMLVAAFVVHAADPFARQEFALLYAIPFLALILTGPGDFSVDRLIARRRGR